MRELVGGKSTIGPNGRSVERSRDVTLSLPFSVGVRRMNDYGTSVD
jgi:hypothetical protein